MSLPVLDQRMVPHGYVSEWYVDDAWRVLPESDGHLCRFTVKRHTFCKRPAVADLQRGKTRWAYCEDHLYGRVLHDGAIWSKRLVERVEPKEG